MLPKVVKLDGAQEFFTNMYIVIVNVITRYVLGKHKWRASKPSTQKGFQLIGCHVIQHLISIY